MPWAALAIAPVALAGLTAPAWAGTVLVVLIVVAALCWTITDSDRSGRLAMLIEASRGKGRQPGQSSPTRSSAPESELDEIR
jgi:hypothetical protein